MNASTAWILTLLLPIAAGAAPATGNPVVYHSPNNGARPAISPYPIAAANDRVLQLYIDFDNTTPDQSTSGTRMCVDKNGDETCAFDISIEMTDGANAATFESFTPGPSGTFEARIEPVARRSLRINGINANGMLPPVGSACTACAKIGTLVVDAAGAAQPFEITVVGVHRVGAAGQLDTIQPRMFVPEPKRGALLGSGIAAVIAVDSLRRRRRRTR